MKIRPKLRAIAAAATVVALSLAGALLGPAAAFADQIDISTNSILWSGVDDSTGNIGEGERYDVANDAFGWNYDALDGFPFRFTLSDPEQGNWDFSGTPSVSEIVQGGTSTITTTGTTTDWAEPYTVVLTLTLQGNYAHWSYTMSNPTAGLGNSSVAFQGDIGSDTDSSYQVNGNTLVSNDEGNGGDPVIGYNVVTDGVFDSWIVTDTNDEPVATATAAGQFDVYLVLYGYTPCSDGFATAKSAVTSLVQTLPATFGERYDDAGSCITVTPVSLTRGAVADEVLSYTIDGALTTPSDYVSASYFTDYSVSSVVDDLPAGLTATSVTQEDGSIIVTISGTPTVSGSFTSRLLFAQQDEGGGFNQILGNIVITVADPVVAGDPGVPVVPVVANPVLANTGIDPAGALGIGGALLLAGIGSVLFVRRRLA